MILHNLQIAISGNNRVFIHYYTCIYAVDIMVGIIQDKSAGIIWNVSRVLQHALCAETFQIFPRFLKMQIGAIHGQFRQNVSSLLQTALAPNAPGDWERRHRQHAGVADGRICGLPRVLSGCNLWVQAPNPWADTQHRRQPGLFSAGTSSWDSISLVTVSCPRCVF